MSTPFKFTPLIKGLITGTFMIGISILLNYIGQAKNSGAPYFFYALYAGGIAWTLIDHYRSANYKPAFGNIFSQGFRCFIIITLISVIFIGVYSSMHPEIAEKAAIEYKTDLIKNGNKTPAEIEKMVSDAKKGFVTGNISLTLFTSLITGAIFTAAGAGLLLMRRK